MDSVYIGNRGGIPIVNTTPVQNASNISFALPNHMFRFSGAKGKIVINLSTAINSSMDLSLPLVFKVNNQELPLQSVKGSQLNASEIVDVLTFECLFDKDSNTIRILSIYMI